MFWQYYKIAQFDDRNEQLCIWHLNDMHLSVQAMFDQVPSVSTNVFKNDHLPVRFNARFLKEFYVFVFES